MRRFNRKTNPQILYKEVTGLGNALTILEVSRKQDYIFASQRLRQNAARSEEIARVTKSGFFSEVAPALYREEDNLVNTGGGHAVLRFADRETARQFVQTLTRAVLQQYPGMELFARTLEYDPQRTPQENMNCLTDALEQKKARRTVSFQRLDLGLEKTPGAGKMSAQGPAPDREAAPDWEKNMLERLGGGFAFPSEFSELNKALGGAGEGMPAIRDNFIAVVHLDGNAMGARVGQLYQKPENADFDACRKDLQRFSKGIQTDFECAFFEMLEELIHTFDLRGTLPLRPVILAGDDVCFVAAGAIGLECARVLLEKLAARQNEADHQPYAACAGVVLVHEKYPFHRAYQMAEELCESAKRFGAGLDEGRRVSAIDWHIEFGQLRDSLADQRAAYQTEDGCRLELRPVTVVVPPELGLQGLSPERTYPFFSALCRTMQGITDQIARGKLKELRTALRQGEEESRFYLRDRRMDKLLYTPFNAAWRTWEERAQQFRAAFARGGMPRDEAFAAFEEKAADGSVGLVKRCLLFDAIEMVDHYIPWKEEAE